MTRGQLPQYFFLEPPLVVRSDRAKQTDSQLVLSGFAVWRDQVDQFGRSDELWVCCSYMYWADWGARPRIERAGMDGHPATRQTLVDSSQLYWPNGLMIDFIDRRFYWTDVKLKYIHSAGLDGTDRRVVVAAGSLPHPVTMTLHADCVYWSDWQTHAIYVSSKQPSADDDVRPRVVAVDVHQLTGLRAYHASRQPHGTSGATITTCFSLHFASLYYILMLSS